MLTTEIPLARARGVIYTYDEDTCDIRLSDGAAGIQLRGLFDGVPVNFPKADVLIISMAP